MNKPLLSICIPTYNRAKYLQASIESIICSDEFLNKEIEIVISDNASTDNTMEMVSKYTHKFDNIIYNRNETNVKDKNYAICIGKARGELRKLSNDTLLYHNGAISKMCTIIKENYNEKPNIFFSNGECDFKGTKEVVGIDELLKVVSFNITWIASFSIWEKDCVNINNDFEDAELQLWQVNKFLQLYKYNNNYYIDNSRYCNIQLVNKKNVSYGLFKVFYNNFFLIIDKYKKQNLVNIKTIDYLEKNLLFNFFMDNLILWKINNGSNIYNKEENLYNCLKDTYIHKNYWKRFVIQYRCRFIYIILKDIIKKIIRKEK